MEYYGPNWRTQKRRARVRDQFRCTECGASEDDLGERLSVAHITPFRAFDLGCYLEANTLTNLRSLCRRCHIKLDWQNGHRG